jgi:tight adherence protein C
MTAVVLGAGVGLGVLLVIRGVWPARVPLAFALERLEGGVQTEAEGSGRGLAAKGSELGRALSQALENAGLPVGSSRQDAAIVGKPLERFYLDKVVFSLAGFLGLPAFAAVVTLAGTQISVALPLWASLIFGVVGFFLPDLLIRGEAAERRRGFRHALGAFLDLVSINLAGGAGVEGALDDAVRVGQGWAFARLGETLAHSRLAGETPWEGLGRLGTELGVAELCELSSSLLLAGGEGAKVRESLSSKAASMRRHQAAEAETKAQEASQKMTFPTASMLFGFFIFLVYPAVTRITSGL